MHLLLATALLQVQVRDEAKDWKLVESANFNLYYPADEMLPRARQFAGRNENMDDLIQVAQLGVLKAVTRFDPELGNTFSTFATR